MLKKQSLTYFENEKLSADSFENREIASCLRLDGRRVPGLYSRA